MCGLPATVSAAPPIAAENWPSTNLRDVAPSDDGPSKNSTVPVGVTPPATEATAIKSGGRVESEGLSDEERVTVLSDISDPFGPAADAVTTERARTNGVRR